ncbi:MAG: glycosyltransferase family 4 protein [Deltaproteobacteria bacterium]|nr:glycosyltransferase family 4 protein [Deltaproteobacteria bacterium]
MRVLQLISSRGFFGAENVVVELAASLASGGDDVIVGAFSNRHAGKEGSSEVLERAKAMGLKTELFECSGRFDLGTIKAVRRFIEKNGIEVIHSHGYKSNIYAYLANRRPGKKLVTTCHNWINASSKMSFYTRLDKFFLRRFDAIAAVSDAVKDELLAAGIDPRKTVVIGNGISLEKFRQPSADKEDVRAALGIPPNVFVAGTVGRMSPEKGYDILLQAAREVLKKKENCFFLFVGDGPQKQALEEQSRSLGIGGRVIFAGKRSDIPEMLSAMDLFVMSSHTEGQPMALLEAMAAGKPVVSTSVGDVPKILDKGKAGLLAPPADSLGLAAAILRVLDDPALAGRLAASALRNVEENYSSKKMAAEYRDCYKGN